VSLHAIQHRAPPGRTLLSRSRLPVEVFDAVLQGVGSVAIYAKGRGAEQAHPSKQKLVESLRQAITETDVFCRRGGLEAPQPEPNYCE
jgi:hypothetical protein